MKLSAVKVSASVTSVQPDFAVAGQIYLYRATCNGYFSITVIGIPQVIQGGDGSEGAQVDLVLATSNCKGVNFIIAVAGGKYESIAAGAGAIEGIIFLAAGDDTTGADGGEGVPVIGADDVFDAGERVSFWRNRYYLLGRCHC